MVELLKVYFIRTEVFFDFFSSYYLFSRLHSLLSIFKYPFVCESSLHYFRPFPRSQEHGPPPRLKSANEYAGKKNSIKMYTVTERENYIQMTFSVNKSLLNAVISK